VTILVDSNVLLEVMTEDPEWSAWSGEALGRCAESSAIAINPLIYAEVSIRFDRIEDLREALSEGDLLRLPLPWDAASLAGEFFVRCGDGAAPGDRPSATSTSAPMRRSPAWPC
jgi:predicted nucleic acid-binding protein